MGSFTWEEGKEVLQKGKRESGDSTVFTATPFRGSRFHRQYPKIQGLIINKQNETKPYYMLSGELSIGSKYSEVPGVQKVFKPVHTRKHGSWWRVAPIFCSLP